MTRWKKISRNYKTHWKRTKINIHKGKISSNRTYPNIYSQSLPCRINSTRPIYKSSLLGKTTRTFCQNYKQRPNYFHKKTTFFSKNNYKKPTLTNKSNNSNSKTLNYNLHSTLLMKLYKN